jgi:uracil phosphoribosyltransferase
MRILAEDALAEFPPTPITFATPCSASEEGVLGPDPTQICAVSIVRSGDALVEAVREVEPAVRVGKILIQRDEDTALPHLLYTKLPPGMDALHGVLMCDPMLATGGSALLALQVLCGTHKVDPTKIILATVVCAPEGIQTIAQHFPTVKIVTIVVDDSLNEQKYIVPGLGDFGDR